MDPRDDSSRTADLDWLYSNKNTPIDHTQVMDDSEMAELERRRNLLKAAQQSQPVDEPLDDRTAPAVPGTDSAAQSPEDAPAPVRKRVVHTEQTSSRRPAASAPRAPHREPVPAPRPAPRPIQAAAMPSPRDTAGRNFADGARPARNKLRVPRFRPLRWIALLLAAWLVWLAVVPMIAAGRMPQIDERPGANRPSEQPGTVTLLVGSDARDKLTQEQKDKLGTGSVDGKRTDTMMLLVQPEKGDPALVSLPRDSYVEIPGHGKNKLNASYAFGGPKLLVETIELNTGLRVDNYLEIGFDGFAGIIDGLGGIEMCLPKAIKDRDSHLNLPAGCQTLDGINALGYVRMRKADPNGDLGRMKRQREMTTAMMKKAASPMTFINPMRYWRINMAAGAALTRGADTSTTELLSIANGIRSVSGGSGHTLTVPISNANATTRAGSSVLWDKERSSQMFSTIAKGSTEGLEQFVK